MIVRIVALAVAVVALQSCTPTMLHNHGRAQPKDQNCPPNCKVDVKARMVAGVCVIDEPGPDDRLVVTGSDRVLVWKLPNDFAFCPANMDGIRFKGETYGQFDENWATEHENGNPPSDLSCKRHYRWRDRNTEHPAGKDTFDYELRFRPTGSWWTDGVLCRLDPWIINR